MGGANRHSVYVVSHNRFNAGGRPVPSCQIYRWARAGGNGGVVVVRAGAGTDAGGVVELLLLPLPPKRKRCGLCARSVIARPAISIWRVAVLVILFTPTVISSVRLSRLSINMRADAVVRSEGTSFCEFKGRATNWTARAGGLEARDAAWG